MTTGKLLALSCVCSAALIASSASAQLAGDGGKRYVVNMTGAAEVPGPGDPDGSGRAVITVNRGQKRVCWDITVSGVDTITAAHIHIGFAGQAFAGNIIVHLDPDTGCTTTPVSVAVLDALIQAPQAFYVNVHNAAFPAGALRGQLK
jgi:hypothetical protein